MIGYQYYECKKKGTMYMCVTTDIKIKSSCCQRNVCPFGIKNKILTSKEEIQPCSSELYEIHPCRYGQ